MMEQSKIKKVTIKAPEPKPDAEKAKRVYRVAVDIIRRHDEIMKQKRAYRDVFLPEAIMLRDRLQEYCEKLMFYSPSDYGRKAEEILWRKAFYEIIQLMKHNKKHLTPMSSLESAYRTHMASAMGYYHHLLCRIQSELHLNLEGVVDFYYLSEARRNSKSTKTKPLPEVESWAMQACHRCLVYLGDLSRYQYDFDGMSSRVLAQRYYYQALSLCPDIGMPNNQLGTLAGSSYYGLDAVYYYIRCIVCPTPFDGAHSNLMRLFEKNRKRFNELNEMISLEGLSPEQQRTKDIKRFVSRFLQLLDIFYTKSRNLDGRGIQDVCQKALHDFNLCMFSQSSNQSKDGELNPLDDKPCQLDDEMVFKIFVICLAIIHMMQKEGNKQVAAAIAFSLALFSHALNHVMMRLQAALYELENQTRIFQSVTPDEVSSSADVEENHENNYSTITLSKRKNAVKNKKQNISANRSNFLKETAKNEPAEKDEKKKLKKSSKLRRMRRRKGSESSSESEGNVALFKNNSDFSEDDVKGAESEDSEEETSNHLLDELSSSDSDDNLMVSQEMRPGFSSVGIEMTTSDHQSITDSEKHLDIATDIFGSIIMDGTIKEKATTFDLSVPRKQSMSDMAECLKDIPLDWLSDAANLLHHTLKFTFATNDNPVDGSNDDSNQMIQTNKQIRIPPGFEKSNESRHVLEISEKLANFDIETDTDISIYPTDAENSTVTESEMDTETETDKDSVIDRSELQEKKLSRLIQVATNEGLLRSIKVYCDWLRINPHIIATCAKISSSIWYRLSVLLNFLPSEMDLSKIEVCGSDRLLQMVESTQNSNWFPTQPLTEDLHLQKLTPLEMAHKEIIFKTDSRIDLSCHQETILRICYLRRFGYFIMKLKTVEFTYSKETGMFYGPQQIATPDIINDKKREEDLMNAEARRNQLMKDMAQLRLQAEVNQLEGSLKSTDAQSKLPPYIVPDAFSLSEYLNLIKQLAVGSRFIIIIPLSVVNHLDFLKKDMTGARDAIRWLEGEFQKGNRFMRAQKSHENNLPAQEKYMKLDKDFWRMLQIIDCCKYLSKQNPNCDLHSMVTLLTKTRVSSSNISFRTKELISKANEEGLRMHTVPEFYGQWKETCKNDKG